MHFVFGEVLVENVVKEFVGDRVIRLALQDAVDLLEDRDVFERGLAKQNLALLDVSLGEGYALRSDLDVAFLQPGESEEDAGLENREQVLDVHD